MLNYRHIKYVVVHEDVIEHNDFEEALSIFIAYKITVYIYAKTRIDLSSLQKIYGDIHIITKEQELKQQISDKKANQGLWFVENLNQDVLKIKPICIAQGNQYPTMHAYVDAKQAYDRTNIKVAFLGCFAMIMFLLIGWFLCKGINLAFSTACIIAMLFFFCIPYVRGTKGTMNLLLGLIDSLLNF